LDVKAFWEENRRCSTEFTTNKPRLRLDVGIGEDLVKSLAGIQDHPRFYTDFDYQQETRFRVSDILEKEIGLSIGPALNVGSVTYSSLFGGQVIYPDNAPPWIAPIIESADDILPLIRRMDGADITKLGIMPRWLEWRERIRARWGVQLASGSAFHGPATMSAMLCGTTRFLYFLSDYPELMHDLYRCIEEVGLSFMKTMRQMTGLPMTGMGIYDDDSALLSPRLFDEFERPVFEHWYDEFSPRAGNPRSAAALPPHRFIHSDGDMTHLLGRLNDIGIDQVNLGPATDIAYIRQMMPRTVIYGHIPPFLVRNGSPEEIVARVQEDFRKVGHDGGVVVETAGSLNEGTPLANLRALMYAVQRYCRFDGK
jgi:uroporphyrinogen decarboxylase